MEDAVAFYSDNSLRPSDIIFLYDGFRRVVLRVVDMRQMLPHQSFDFGPRRSADIFLADSGFYHGPSPKAVIHTIRYIRELLWSKEKECPLVAFMKQARQQYEENVNYLGESHSIVRNDRTLKTYLCPSLSVTNIVLRRRSRKIGMFFCTLD